MKRLFSVLLAVGAIAVLGVAVAAWGKPGNHHQGGKTITVIEHANTDATADTGAPGDSAGDVLTFANAVFNARDTRKVGTDQGYCIRTVAGVAYECNITTFLPAASWSSRARSTTPRTACSPSRAAPGGTARPGARCSSTRVRAGPSSSSCSTSAAKGRRRAALF